MNTTQLTALCQRYQGILLDADNEVVHIAVVDAPSHELLDALHFATPGASTLSAGHVSKWKATRIHRRKCSLQ